MDISQIMDILPEMTAVAMEKCNENELPAVMLTNDSQDPKKPVYTLRVVAVKFENGKKVIDRTLLDDGKPMSYDLSDIVNQAND